MPRDAVSRTAHVGTVGKNGLTILNWRYQKSPPLERLGSISSRCSKRGPLVFETGPLVFETGAYNVRNGAFSVRNGAFNVRNGGL